MEEIVDKNQVLWYTICKSKEKKEKGASDMYHVSQFYPCSHVELGSEVYYLCEIGRYLKNQGKGGLSVNGVIFDDCLKTSVYWNYFRYASENGYLVDLGELREELAISESEFENYDLSRYFTTDLDKENIAELFDEATQDCFKWTSSARNPLVSQKNNLVIVGTYRNQAIVSLIAMVAVTRVLTGFPKELTVDLTDSFTYLQMSTADIILLRDKTEALQSWVTVTIDNELQNTYQAWVFEQREKGYMLKFCPLEEKKVYMNKLGFEPNDIVFLYERTSTKQDDTVRQIDSCKLAKIISIDGDGVSFDIINTVVTKLTAQKKYDNYPYAVKQMYKDKSYLKYHTTRRKIQWLSLGIDNRMYMEDYFISDLNKDDFQDLWVEREIDGVHEECQLRLDVLNAVYWILKDRQVSFNEEKFLDTYFKDKLPLYTQYMYGKNPEEFVDVVIPYTVC